MNQIKSNFKLTITGELQSKFFQLIGMMPNNEYGGFVFYRIDKMTDDFSKIEITCFDILLMSVGSAAYNSFRYDAELGHYMLLKGYYGNDDIQYGIFHSHNTMSATPSSKDMETFENEGKDRVHSLSLIINNNLSYTAMITRKITYETEYVRKFNYSSFGAKTIGGENKGKNKNTVVEYAKANNIIIENTNADKYINIRFDEIVKQNKERAKEEAVKYAMVAKDLDYSEGIPKRRNNIDYYNL